MKSENSELPEKKNNFKEFILLLIKSAPLLYLLSIALGMSILINLFTPNGRENHFIFFQIPGLLYITQGYLILFFLSILMLIGSIFSLLKREFAIALLTYCWFLLAFGIRLWEFSWLPTIKFGLPISFGFIGSLIYIKVNLGALLFFIWSLSLLLKTKTIGFLTRA